MSLKRAAIVATLSLALSGVSAFAAPTVDGHYDPNEGYTNGNMVNFDIQNGPTSVSGGQLWTYQDPSTKDVYVAFFQPLSINDNSYGTGSVGSVSVAIICTGSRPPPSPAWRAAKMS